MDSFLKKQILIFILCFLCSMTRHATIESWYMIKPEIRRDLKFGGIELGAIDMIFLFCYAAGNVINGLLGDKYSPKFILHLGMLISCIGQCIVLNI